MKCDFFDRVDEVLLHVYRKRYCYIRGNAVHRSWNRAYTLHAVHNLLVEDNIAFDITGHAFFIEDGFETGNMLKHNLALGVKRPRNAHAKQPSIV